MRIYNPRSTLAGIKSAHQERLTVRTRQYGKEKVLTLLRQQPKSSKKLS